MGIGIQVDKYTNRKIVRQLGRQVDRWTAR